MKNPKDWKAAQKLTLIAFAELLVLLIFPSLLYNKFDITIIGFLTYIVMVTVFMSMLAWLNHD